jgi:dienelactone hydrolase
MAASSQAPDLILPDVPSSLGMFSTPKMGLYRPEGTGPFPALVLHHQCSGLREGKNTSMLNWAKEAVSRGYVVLMLLISR